MIVNHLDLGSLHATYYFSYQLYFKDLCMTVIPGCQKLEVIFV